MRDYGKVQTEFWEHAGVRRLTTEARLLYLYLLTGPHTNMVGCFKVPKGYVADDLGWVAETVSDGFAELSREGFATYDEANRYVLVHGFLKFNKIANRNIAVPMMEWFRGVPELSLLKPLLAQEIVDYVDKIDQPMRTEIEPFLKPFRERLPDPENREQRTEEGIGNFVSHTSVEREPAPDAANDDAIASRALVLSGEPSTVKRGKAKADPTSIEQTDFDAFWSVYPRREAKKAALEAFLAVVRSGRTTAQDVFNGAVLYAASREGENPKFTALPASWLNGRRWEDEIADPPQGGYREQRGGGWDPMQQAIDGIDFSKDFAA